MVAQRKSTLGSSHSYSLPLALGTYASLADEGLSKFPLTGHYHGSLATNPPVPPLETGHFPVMNRSHFRYRGCVTPPRRVSCLGAPGLGGHLIILIDEEHQLLASGEHAAVLPSQPQSI